ncbi:MAG: DUF2892 domain-containing protein [Vulcanimicrobiaceae bacterium]
MASSAGRAARVMVGIALVTWGFALHSSGGYVLMIVGLLPLATGVLDVCLVGPVLGVPLRGADVRRMPN